MKYTESVFFFTEESVLYVQRVNVAPSLNKSNTVVCMLTYLAAAKLKVTSCICFLLFKTAFRTGCGFKSLTLNTSCGKVDKLHH